MWHDHSRYSCTSRNIGLGNGQLINRLRAWPAGRVFPMWATFEFDFTRSPKRLAQTPTSGRKLVSTSGQFAETCQYSAQKRYMNERRFPEALTFPLIVGAFTRAYFTQQVAEPKGCNPINWTVKASYLNR